MNTIEEQILEIHRDALERGIRISMIHLMSMSNEDLDNLQQQLQASKERQEQGNLTLFEFLRLFEVQPLHIDAFVAYYIQGLKTPACCAYKCLVFPNDLCSHGNPAMVSKLNTKLLLDV